MGKIKIAKLSDEQRKWLLRTVLIWVITGAVYYVIHGILRMNTDGSWANITMMPVGGFCGVLIAMMNENAKVTEKRMCLRALRGMAVFVVVEFVCGYVMNRLLGMNIWSYAAVPANFLGQICLPAAALWFLLTPLVIWIDGFLRRKLWNDGDKCAWYTPYVQLFTLK